MNAPLRESKLNARYEDQRIAQLVEAQLAREEAWRDALSQRYEANLERFLRMLAARRRAAARARLLRSIDPRRGRPGLATTSGSDGLELPGIRGRVFGRLGAPRLSGVARKLGLLVLTAAVIFTFCAFFLEPIFRPFLAGVETRTVTAAERALRCGDANMVRDRNGEWIGVLPSVGCAAGRPHLSAPFDPETTLQVAEAIGVLEGRWEVGAFTFFGHDFWGMARYGLSKLEGAARSVLTPDVPPSTYWVQPGGSAPILSAFESVIGNPHAITSFRDKVENVAMAALFEARVLGGDRLARARFVAERMPVLDGRGYALAGAIGAEVLFGGPPRTLAERCVFAAAAGFPLYLPRHDAGPEYLAIQGGRLAKARSRAAHCAEELAASEQEREPALAEIAAFEPAMERAPRLGRALLPAVAGEWTLRTAAEPRSDDRLTVDHDAQTRAEPAIRNRLNAIAPRLTPGLCFDGECETQADYVVAIAERDRERLPLRVVATNRYGAVFGPLKTTDQGPVRGSPAFGLGSAHKTPLTLVAADHGEWRLCNRRHGDIENVAGPAPVARCAPDGQAGWIDTREALGRSLNLPWVDLARRHASDVDALERALGYGGEPAGAAGAALGFGRTAPPERFMALLAAMVRGAEGGPARTEGLALLKGEPAPPVDLAELGFDPTHVATAAGWLEAPVQDGGTLQALPRALEPLGCEATHGKTGTGEVAGSDAARSRLALAAISCGLDRYIAFASLASSHGRRALGDVSSSDVAALVAAALTGLTEQRGDLR